MTDEAKQTRPPLTRLQQMEMNGEVFVSWRNPEDDRIGIALKQAAAELKAAGKPLFNEPESEAGSEPGNI